MRQEFKVEDMLPSCEGYVNGDFVIYKKKLCNIIALFIDGCIVHAVSGPGVQNIGIVKYKQIKKSKTAELLYGNKI